MGICNYYRRNIGTSLGLADSILDLDRPQSIVNYLNLRHADQEENNNTSVETEEIGENMDMTGMTGMFNGMFGHLGAGMCRLGINGDMAVKTSNGYKTYNVKTGRLTNVTQFCFDIGQEFFFVMPTTKARKGDILLVDGHPKCVIENNDNKTIKVMDYENSAIQEIVPERHVFMGQTYFYRKIVSMFGSGNFLKGSKGMNKMMKLMMMKEMFGGMFGKSSNTGDTGNAFAGMLPMMLMGNMFGGDKDSEFGNFSEMFDLDFDGDDETDDEDTDEAADKA